MRSLAPTTCRLVLTGLLMGALAFPAACGDDDDHDNGDLTPAPHAQIEVLTASPHAVGDTVVLSGSASTPGGSALTFAWSILEAPSGSSATVGSFINGVTDLSLDVEGDYLVELTVSNADGEDAAQVVITAAPEGTVAPGQAPRAAVEVETAPPHRVGDAVLLDGSGSEPAGSALGYLWTLVSAPSSSSASVIAVTDGLAELIPDAVGDYVVRLTVSNSDGQDDAFVQVTAVAAPSCLSNADCAEPTPVCDTVQGACVGCLVLSDCAHRPGTLCSQGVCACAGGQGWCAPDQCVDFASDPNHCGACNRACYGSCIAGNCADPWAPVSTVDAPSARAHHVAVWTGTHMVVWGGNTDSGYTNTGGRYDPATHQWSPVSIVNAPSPRERATAVWTGTHMIVWGGFDGSYMSTGGRYDPVTDTWETVALAAAPVGRNHHTAVWTGTHMIVFGGRAGDQLNSGGLYNPTTDTWAATASPLPTPNIRREDHTAVWNSVDGVMVIYGGYGDTDVYPDVYFPHTATPGGQTYDPVLDQWANLNTIAEPGARARHSAVFDGTHMLLWGGYSGVYQPNGFSYHQGAWLAMGGAGPEGREAHTAVYVSGVQRMIVWGGQGAAGTSAPLNTGAEFDIASNSWSATLPTAPEGRRHHTAVATPTAMIVWGGYGASSVRLGTGGVYTPAP